MSYFIAFALLCITAASVQSSKPRGVSDEYKRNVQLCLAEAELKLEDLGISSIDELNQGDLAWIHYVPAKKKFCFMACWFKQNDIIDENGTINSDNLPEPLPGKTFPVSFEESIKECKAKQTYCDVGRCLYEIYYT